MQIAQNAGELVAQILTGAVKIIEITAYGALAQLDIEPLETAILKGILSTHFEGVNYVNAPVIAKKRDISLRSSKVSGGTDGIIEVKLVSDKGVQLVASDVSHIIKIDDYKTSITPKKHMLFVPHVDQPGMIAQVALILGDAGINITAMNVVQKENALSIMVITIGSPVDNDILSRIDKIDGIHDTKYVRLSV
jgi:D-3-phosphoglycerate dehydrogenase